MTTPPPPPVAAGRYVVLHHTGHGAAHFDLMLERAGEAGLETYRVAAWPPVGGVAAEALPDHRAAYLTYEGPVSRGRGEVRRVEAGTWRDAPADGTSDRRPLRLMSAGGEERALTLLRDNGTWLVAADAPP